MRIAAKKIELEQLKQLRDLSGAMATQMQALEKKLSTLNDGTQAVACVLSNWENVLRAISMASAKAASLKIPVDEDSAADDQITIPALPSTLVRIPAERLDRPSDR